MTAFTFDTPTLLRLQLPRYERVRIRLVGCGGTGSHLATGLGVLARELIDRGTPCDLAFIDGDRVEQKNVGRQLFSAGDVGRYKAEALARRVGAAYNLPALARTAHVKTAAELGSWRAEPDRQRRRQPGRAGPHRRRLEERPRVGRGFGQRAPQRPGDRGQYPRRQADARRRGAGYARPSAVAVPGGARPC